MKPTMQSSFYDYHQRISEISARMVKASKEELDDEIQQSLKEAVQPLGVDRGGLLRVFEDSPVVHIAYAWYMRDSSLSPRKSIWRRDIPGSTSTSLSRERPGP